MISKERLEELIKEGATIWDDEVCEVRLIEDNKHIVNLHNNYLYIANYVTNIAETSSWWDDYTIGFDNLFETKEDAEFVREFGCVERTERLELPAWEEFRNKKIKQLGFIGKDTICFFELYEDEQKNRLILLDHDCDYEYFNEEPTKENYITACKLCKEFFLGGGDGDIR